MKILAVAGFMALSSCSKMGERLREVEEKSLAMIVHNCSFKHGSITMPCSFLWVQDGYERESHKFLPLLGKNSKNAFAYQFVGPGTYRLSSFYAGPGNTYWTIKFKPTGPQAIDMFSVKGGEVVYLGGFFVDRAKSELFLHATTIKSHPNLKPALKEAFESNSYAAQHLSLLDRLRDNTLGLSDIGKFVKYAVPHTETK